MTTSMNSSLKWYKRAAFFPALRFKSSFLTAMVHLVFLVCVLFATATAKPNRGKAVTSRVVNPDLSVPADAVHLDAGSYYQGDMIMPAGFDATNRYFTTWKEDFWPDAKVCYYFDSTATPAMKDAVNAAIKDFHTFSCVRFHEKTSTDQDCIKIIKGDGCNSYLGRIGGEQSISLGNGCQYKGIAIHELLHALGRTHEQNRSDRDDYVEILWENIHANYKDAFAKLKDEWGYSADGFPYDYGSIMQYQSDAFAKAKGINTMLAKDKTRNPLISANEQGFTELDLKKLNKVYCNGKGPDPATTTTTTSTAAATTTTTTTTTTTATTTTCKDTIDSNTCFDVKQYGLCSELSPYCDQTCEVC